MTVMKEHNTLVGGRPTPGDLPPTGFPIATPPASLPAHEHLFGRVKSKEASTKIPQQHKVGKALCGAKTRKGAPCVRRVVPGRYRCPNHGGLSTGPRTPEGRARVAMNLPNVRVRTERERSS